MLTPGIDYPPKVFYTLGSKDGNGQNAGQQRAALIVMVDDETQIASLVFFPLPGDGFDPSAILVAVQNVPYQPTDEKKGAISPQGTWF